MEAFTAPCAVCLDADNLNKLSRIPHTQLYQQEPDVISGFCRKVDEQCALLGYYAASSGNLSQTFRGNLSAPSGVKNPSIMQDS